MFYNDFPLTKELTYLITEKILALDDRRYEKLLGPFTFKSQGF